MNVSLLWSHFHPYQSVSFCQSFLKSCYERAQLPEPTGNSYKNGYPLCYYLEHGKQYYLQAEQAPYEIKPVLLFYGMVQLLKACLLIADPDFPEKTHVLAHGVSSRKKKKQSYRFLDDNVKIQRLGLFPHIAEQIFHMEHFEGKKFSMEPLLKVIPELGTLFERLNKKNIHYPLSQITNEQYTVSALILDDFHVSYDRFGQLLKKFNGHLQDNQLKDGPLIIQFDKKPKPFYPSLFQQDTSGCLYLPKERDNDPILPEMLVHYLVLYNLSMISRYETEWWYDLTFQRVSSDISYIKAFLDVTAFKLPLLVNHYLKDLEQ